ncbi:MAG TPA: phosphatase PAP2 family protein [Acidimicrobiales bacterium]|nr:phosphatase PAP2 family protein [Acidimicrobiales bacterium]
MAQAIDAEQVVPAGVAAADVAPRRLYWWREALYVLAFYGVYSYIRNQFGSASVSPDVAYRNARHIIRMEEFLHIFHEQAIQSAVLGWHSFLVFWNVYYGSFHFVVTTVALIWMFRSFPKRYPLWRNTLAFTTGFALIGFATFPLMPPRLLPTSYGFVDTLDKFGTLWSFDSGTMQKLSNQYAAMPSLHCAWALWCVLVMWPQLKSNWSRALLILYPFATVYCIVVTANHYFLDAVGGFITLGLGFCAAKAFTAWHDRRWAAKHPEAATP